MKLRIFSIYDQAAKAYLPPFFMPEAGVARRVFSDCVNDPKHQFSKHPQDYFLYLIGDFDDNTGAIVDCTPELVVPGLEVKRVERNDPDLFADASAQVARKTQPEA